MSNRAQGAFEYVLLLAAVLSIVILTFVMLRGNLLGSANQTVAGQVAVLTNITNASAVLANLNPTPPPGPSVALNSPSNGGVTSNNTQFQYTPSGMGALAGAALFGNFTGLFVAAVSNSSPIVNGSVNNFSLAVPPGYYVWNVQVCDVFANCSFAPSNFSYTAQYSGTWTQTSQLDFSAGNSSNLDLSTQAGNVSMSVNLSAPVWTNRAPATSPSGRMAFGMAFDSINNVSVLFGGQDSGGGYLNDTWWYYAANNTWVNMTPASLPPARAFTAMSFDASRGVFVLFGGGGLPGLLGDTWIYNASNNTWFQVYPAVAPPARNQHVMAYDSTKKVTVLFSGNNGAADTWAFNASTYNWTNMLPASSPGWRMVPGFSFDSIHNEIVMFGGIGGAWYGDTWRYNASNNTWYQVFPSPTIAGRVGMTSVFDPVNGVTYFYGGWNGGTPTFYDTAVYNYSNNSWASYSPATRPGNRAWYGLDYDAVNRYSVFFGGSDGGYRADTWSVGFGYSLSNGSLISQVFDAGANSTWSYLNWSQYVPASTNVTLRTRSCSLSNCSDGVFSSALYCAGASCNQAVSSPSSRRYFQWMAYLNTTNASNTPILSEVNVTYRVP